jgi:hypothetical protein
VGEDGGLIAGHARVLAARQLGIAEIPVMVAAGWTEAQKRAYDHRSTLSAGHGLSFPAASRARARARAETGDERRDGPVRQTEITRWRPGTKRSTPAIDRLGTVPPPFEAGRGLSRCREREFGL